MNDEPHLFQGLTREEFKLVFAVASLASSDMFGGCYNINRHYTPDAEGDSDDWLELVKRSIRFLAFDCGVEFCGLEAVDDGRILMRDVEPRNVAYAYMLQNGMLPNIEDACNVALEFAPHAAPSLDLEPMRAALVAIDRHKKNVAKQLNPEAVVELMRLREQALLDAYQYDKETN